MLGSKIKLKTGSSIGSGVSAGSLKTASAISASLQTVTDTAGNNSALQISSAAVGFAPAGSSAGSINANGLIVGSGTVTQNAALTVKGFGSNILSLRNSANVEVIQVNSTGALLVNSSIQTLATIFAAALGPGGGNTFIFADSSNQIRLGQTTFNTLNFGSVAVGNPALVVNGSGLDLKTGTGSALSAFSASQFTSSNLSAGTLTTARPVKFGDRATISEAAFIALGLSRQIAIEHNGVVYYIPCSLTVIP
jgi:hypothetical protein